MMLYLISSSALGPDYLGCDADLGSFIDDLATVTARPVSDFEIGTQDGRGEPFIVTDAQWHSAVWAYRASHPRHWVYRDPPAQPEVWPDTSCEEVLLLRSIIKWCAGYGEAFAPISGATLAMARRLERDALVEICAKYAPELHHLARVTRAGRAAAKLERLA